MYIGTSRVPMYHMYVGMKVLMKEEGVNMPNSMAASPLLYLYIVYQLRRGIKHWTNACLSPAKEYVQVIPSTWKLFEQEDIQRAKPPTIT